MAVLLGGAQKCRPGGIVLGGARQRGLPAPPLGMERVKGGRYQRKATNGVTCSLLAVCMYARFLRLGPDHKGEFGSREKKSQECSLFLVVTCLLLSAERGQCPPQSQRRLPQLLTVKKDQAE